MAHKRLVQERCLEAASLLQDFADALFPGGFVSEACRSDVGLKDFRYQRIDRDPCAGHVGAVGAVGVVKGSIRRLLSFPGLDCDERCEGKKADEEIGAKTHFANLSMEGDELCSR